MTDGSCRPSHMASGMEVCACLKNSTARTALHKQHCGNSTAVHADSCLFRSQATTLEQELALSQSAWRKCLSKSTPARGPSRSGSSCRYLSNAMTAFLRTSSLGCVSSSSVRGRTALMRSGLINLQMAVNAEQTAAARVCSMSYCAWHACFRQHDDSALQVSI